MTSPENLRAILARIEAARKTAVAPASSTTLIAVAKTHDETHMLPVLEAGHRIFGENRVQEAQAKSPPLQAKWSELRLHLVGPLQTNKAQDAVRLFDAIETVDRPRLAEALARAMAETGRRPSCLIQVNIGREPQKAGVDPAEADAFIALCLESWHLPIAGLMCIPPVAVDPRPHFAALAALARRHGLADLSMGMSADFEIAIAEGATLVRIGTAIFGARPG